MHPAAYRFVSQVASVVPRPDGITLEIGGRNVNGTIREFFPAPYVSVDIAPGPGVDVVANGADYQPSAPPACVVCCEVLEHTEDADRICANALTALVPGGLFVVTAAGEGRDPHSAVDGGPLRAGEFYRNVSDAALKQWLSGFAELQVIVNPEAKDIYALARKAQP